MARPPKPDDVREAAIAHVIEQIALGRPVTEIFAKDRAELEGKCSIATWGRWIAQDQALREEVERARELGCERLVEEMITIADDRTGDTDPQSRRVRIYAREKAAQMLAPRRFGPRVDVTSGGKALPAPSVTLIDNRIQSVLMLVQQRKADDEATRLLLD
jgi:hypothetical protein